MKRSANEDDGWASDGALFTRRGPIRSHRRSGRRRTGLVRLGAVAVATSVAAASWNTVAGLSDRAPTSEADQSSTGTEAPVEPVPPEGWGDATASPTPTARRAPTSPPAKGPAGPAAPPTSGWSAAPASPAAPAPRPASTTPPATVSAGPTPPRATMTAGPSAVAPGNGLMVQVMSRASGLPVGVRGGSTSDGASVVQRSTAGAATRWRLVSAGSGCYQLANGSSGKALDLTDGSHADGTPMQQWTIGPGNINQTWCFHSVGGGWYSIRNAASGALLDLRDGGAGDGVTIQQWGADPAAPNAHQTWKLLPAG